MEKESRKVVLIGLGFFGKELLKALKDNWEVIVIDLKEEKFKEIEDEYKENVQFLQGDASSVLTWKKLNLEEIKYVVSTVKDLDVNLEVCRIIRDVFNLDINIIILLFESNLEKEIKFQEYKVFLVKPVELINNIILHILEKNYAKAVNIGFGKGEIIEVPILAKSHLVDRKLKYLKPTKWRIAAIYRGDQLIIPSGDTYIKVGDRVILIGDPKVLENLVNILIKGVPQFPLQFGSDIIVPVNEKFKKSVEESIYFYKHTKVQKFVAVPYKNRISQEFEKELKEKIQNIEIGKRIRNIKDLLKYREKAGLYVIPYIHLGFFEKKKIKHFFRQTKPFLLSHDTENYKEIIISLNSPDPAFILEIGIELSRMFSLSFRVVFVALPKELRGEEENKEIEERQNIVSDFENIYKKSINFTILNGNPVLETIKFVRNEKNSLLVITSDPEEEISIFNPNVSYLIARKSPISTLVVPLGESYE